MDDVNGPLWGCILFLVFLILNGIFYGFGAAIQHLNDSEMEREALDGNRTAAKIWKIMQDPEKFVSSILVLTILLGVCYGTFGVDSFVNWMKPYIDLRAAYLIVIIVSAVLLTSLGILSFKKVCTFYPNRISRMFIGIVRLMMAVLTPVSWITAGISKMVVKILGLDKRKIPEDVTGEEILSIVDEAHEQGVIEESEAEMIQNLITFREKDAQDIMTPRKNIAALEGQMTLDEAVKMMLEEGYSRYPVYADDLDNILGILHFKDVMRVASTSSMAGGKPIREIPGMIRPAIFIPQTRGINQLFQGMQARKTHLVVVVDEYGQTVGLVSMEDILEEIVGEINDEYDEDEQNIQPQLDQSILIDGFTRLEELEEELGMDFGEQEVETLNGYLTSVLDHIPTVKDKEVIANGYRFEILSVENNTIQKVKAKKLPPSVSEPGAENR